MPFITTREGIEIFYKDWGQGQPIVFSHGWPLSADDWDTQMLYFLSRGYRVIAHDRRGHGRSTQVADGHDMDHYADDLAALTGHLDLKNAIHVGHSTGGGEVVHYLARHGESRVQKAVMIAAVPPLMVKTAANPGGLRIYGEIVELFAEEGNFEQACELEDYWNHLQEKHRFTLLCGYSAAHFADPRNRHHLREVCGRHSAVKSHSADSLGTWLTSR